MKNAMEQVRPKARIAFELVEKMTEEDVITKFNSAGCTSKKEAIIMVLEERFGQSSRKLGESLEIVSRDMWSILSAKSN